MIGRGEGTKMEACAVLQKRKSSACNIILIKELEAVSGQFVCTRSIDEQNARFRSLGCPCT